MLDDLAAMNRLYAMATRFVRDGDLAALLVEAVDAAMAIAGADAVHLQLLRQPSGELNQAVHRGCEPALLEHLERAATAAGARGALAHGGQTVIEELAATKEPVAGVDHDGISAAGMRALQLTPLCGHSGKVLGLLSTCHRGPRSPDERVLRLLDLIARQCADAAERASTMQAPTGPGDAQWAERVRETEELFRTTVENMPVNLVLCDRDGRLLYLNPMLEAMVARTCGRKASECIGRPGAEVWPEPIWVPLRTHIERAVATGERQSYELATVLANGEPMVREWAVVPLAGSDGSVHRVLAMSHDITSRRRLVDELREADRRKSEFIAMLSHELRNPLAAIKTGLYVLEHDATSRAAGRVPRAIERQVDHLVRMVDDLLDIGRISEGKIRLQLRGLDLNLLVREAIEDGRQYLERGGVRIEAQLVSSPIHVDADGARMAQVVTNLLSNATKFTPPGGTATVSLCAEGGMAVLRVADTGAGIEAELLPRLFEPFMQADRTLDRSSGGLGLGLALVKGLVALHGGEVSAKSSGAGRGAEFVVRLPLAAEATVDARAIEPAAPTSRRVLVIEDDLDIAETLQAALRIDGHVVEIARTGRDGIELARTFHPDVVLCDIGLPGVDGYQVVRALRADDTLGAVLLVAVTGYAQPGDIAAARAAGFDHHLSKPANMDTLRRILIADRCPGRPADRAAEGQEKQRP